MAELLIPPFWEFADNDGNPLSGGFVYTYSAGTTTPKATYTDSGAGTQNANPVVLDSAGRAVIWGDGSYKFVVQDSLGNTIKTVDNVTTYNTLADAVEPYFETFSGNGTQTVFTLSDDVGTDSKNVQIWVADGLLESVTNGDFATDSDWTKGTGWTIGSGVATATGAISTALSQTSAETLLEGQAYVLVYTVTRSAGGIIPSIGGQNGTERTASGTYREVIVAGSTQTLAFTGNAFTGTLDDISITPAVSGKLEIQNPSSYTVNGTTLTFTSAPPPGTNNIYINSPSLLLGAASNAASAAEAAQTGAEAAETGAEAAQTAAETARDLAQNYAAALTGTSTTSLSVGTGSKVFTVEAGKQWALGQRLRAASDDGSSYIMDGEVTDYTGTSLTIDIDYTEGSGTNADWNISIIGERGATGPAGSVSATDLISAATSAGLVIEAANGTDVANLGSGNTANATFYGNVSMNTTGKIVNMADPTSAQDAATKAYVDAEVAGIVSPYTDIGDTTVSVATANVTHSFTADTYLALEVFITNISSAGTNAALTVSLADSGGNILSVASGTLTNTNSYCAKFEFLLMTEGSTKQYIGNAVVLGNTLNSATQVQNGSTSANSPDRVIVTWSGGINIDAGARVVTKARNF